MQNDKFRTISLFSISADEPLPFRLAIFYKGRHLVYRMPGQAFESHFYNKFVYKRIHRIFVPETDFPTYLEYIKEKEEADQKIQADPNIPEEQKQTARVLGALKTATNSIFEFEEDAPSEKVVNAALDSCKQAVETIAGKPYIQIFTSLSYKANSIADHSMRVSVLATYLGYQLGFVNPIALEHLAAAGLMHDIGKTKLNLSDAFLEDGQENQEVDEELMRQHPIVSCDMLTRIPFVPQEVVRIIREHHEARDGSGFPAGLRGPKMFGLSKVFTIANAFDNISSLASGDRDSKYLHAAKVMLTDRRNEFDANLLPKAVRLLTHSLG